MEIPYPYKIFILDSPSPDDIFHGRTQGQTLSAALDLVNLPAFYRMPVNFETFVSSLEIVETYCTDFIRTHEGILARNIDIAPHIHFSVPASKKGLELTSGECVTWSKLSDLLIEFLHSTRLLKNTALASVPLSLSFSTCEEVRDLPVFLKIRPEPFLPLVSPPYLMPVANMLVAYITFFQALYGKQKTVDHAVERATEAAGIYNAFRKFPFYLEGLRELRGMSDVGD